MEKEKLPNATLILILGMLSILTCCCYGFIGLGLGITALILAKKDLVIYNQDPGRYKDFANVITGRTLAVVGIVLSALAIFFFIIVTAVGEDGMKQWQENLMEKVKYEQENQ